MTDVRAMAGERVDGWLDALASGTSEPGSGAFAALSAAAGAALVTSVAQQTLRRLADDDAAVFDALRAGARGYLLKGADRLELGRAIRAVAAGEAIFGPNVARRLMAYFAGAPIAPLPAFPELSEREREILELIARGMSNQQIVDRLVISPKTVRNHVSNIFSKMQVRDRAEAVVRAREAGLGGERPPS